MKSQRCMFCDKNFMASSDDTFICKKCFYNPPPRTFNFMWDRFMSMCRKAYEIQTDVCGDPEELWDIFKEHMKKTIQTHAEVVGLANYHAWTLACAAIGAKMAPELAFPLTGDLIDTKATLAKRKREQLGELYEQEDQVHQDIRELTKEVEELED